MEAKVAGEDCKASLDGLVRIIDSLSDGEKMTLQSAIQNSMRLVGKLVPERTSGHYTMTLALLNLVQQLLHEAFASVLTIPPDNQGLKQVKEEVLLQAATFVHGEIWVEHLSWKYAQLGDRFEIGRRVSSFYGYVLEQSPPAFTDALMHKPATSTINPLSVSSIGVAPRILCTLYAS